MEHTSEPTASSELIQGAPFVVVQVDAAGKVLTWNTAAERMFGVRGEDAIGRPIAAVAPVPGEDGAWQALLAAGKPARREWEVRKDGPRVIKCAWTVQPLQAGGLACYGQELDDPTHEARQQKIRDLLLRAMLDTLDIVAWVTDKHGNATLVDGKGLARTGLTPEQMLGRNIIEIYGARYPVMHGVLEGQPIHLSGQEGPAHFETWAVPMRDEHGQQVAVVAFSLDITEAKVREQELQNKIDLIQRQQQAMREMSTPIIEVWDHVICLPLVGLVDTARTADIMESLLQAVTRTRARYAILDLTGVDVLDTATANHLLGMTRALRLLGAEGVLTGMHPNVARTVVTIGVDLSTMVVRATLRDALKFVLGALERR
ncbi:MAG TPA: PAS domain-containing protein [Nannocystis sp.]|jgi:rsbT co-antagonist protein RsbR